MYSCSELPTTPEKQRATPWEVRKVVVHCLERSLHKALDPQSEGKSLLASSSTPKFVQAYKNLPPKPDVLPDASQSFATLRTGGIVQEQEKIKKFIQDSEGLNISQYRKKQLSEQWKFYLTSEPIQRGIDTGILLGSLTSVGSCYWPRNRVPFFVASYWCLGFAAGMLTMPLFLIYFEITNEARIKRDEKRLFAKQRKEYLESLKNS